MFKHLFSPKSINTCEIPNRFAVTAMVSNYCNQDGTATDQYIAYHVEKAKGGWGLIITEDYAVSPHAMGYQYVAGLWNDEQISGHKKLTDAVHQYDSKIFAQIYHAGRQSCSAVNGGVQPVAPSAIPCPWNREIPHELTIPEIEQIIEDFGDCALRAQKAGFDGVEIHAGHGYLIAEFLSTYVNKRTDQYGGCLDNRVRFLQEIYYNIREKVGKDFPVTVRFSVDEDVPGGRTIAESRVLAKLFEQWGIDALHVSNGVYGSHNTGIVASMYTPHAWTVDYAAEIKQIVQIPIFTVNRINDPRMADGIIEMGKADFIGMGRGSLADPHLPNKAKAGELTSIRYCIGCLQGCTGSLYTGTALACLVNPTLGKEWELDYTPVEQAKKVVVIGGGPGGLEAARIAAVKGHMVTLYERRSFLGGQFVSAAYPPGKGELANYTTWIINELSKLNVHIHLNTEATMGMIQELQPDTVIVATGGVPVLPPIKGIDKAHVCTAEDVLLGYVPTGNRVVIAGGGEVGTETAAHLAVQEKQVTIVEMASELMRELDGVNRYNITKILKEYEVTAHLETKVTEIMEEGVVVEHASGKELLSADTVVIALGYRPNNELVTKLKETCDHVVVVGGALQTSNALQAIKDGFEAGMSI